MEPKIDGWRMQISVGKGAGEVVAWTRTQHDATGKMPRVEHQLRQMSRHHSFVLDGEAVYLDDDEEPDYNFTARCLGSGPDVCVMKQRDVGPLTYFVFDIFQLDGHDVRHAPLSYRKKLLKKYFDEYANVKFILGDEPTFEQHAANFAQYKEGSVLKLRSATYAGRRHRSWLKWKEEWTVDARIIGFKPGQGKFEGLIGAIQFQALSDHTIGFCSGMDDETRIWISDHQAELLVHPAIIEIKHYGKLVDGYRHPQFVRFREDLA